MRDLLTACAAGYHQSQPLIDTIFDEERLRGPEVVVALHRGSQRLVLAQQMEQPLSLDAFDACLEACALGCEAVARYMRQELLQHTRRQAAARAAVRL